MDETMVEATILSNISIGREENGTKTFRDCHDEARRVNGVDNNCEILNSVAGATASGDDLLIFDSEEHSISELSGSLSDDHWFLTLLDGGTLDGITIRYSRRDQTIRAYFRISAKACGHKGLVHGGLISSLLDETFGALLFSAVKHGSLERGAFMTARLEIDYKKPLLANSVAFVSGAIESIEGRKMWVAGTVMAEGDTEPSAVGRALFIRPKESIPS